MPELVDHVAHLSQDIGPRPAGTEEEQQAALYIAEHLQKDAGFPAHVEEFNAPTDADLPRMICGGIALLAVLIALIIPGAGVLSLLLGIIAVVLYGAEMLDRPVLSRLLPKGVSQNVVAKYEPGEPADGNPRRRKVILVAHYDSGKVRVEQNGFLGKQRYHLQVVMAVGMVLVPVFVLIRNMLFGDVVGAVHVVLTVLLVLAGIAAILPLVFGIVHRIAPYNDGANCNASGTAVLLDVAKRIGRGRVSEEEYEAREAIIHGEKAAREEGLVPEGAEIVYESQGIKPPEPAPQTEEERLAMAKAAIAALTGKPVEGAAPVSDISQFLVQVHERPVNQPSEEEVREQQERDREAFSAVLDSAVRTAHERVETQHAARQKAAAEAAAKAEEERRAAEAAAAEAAARAKKAEQNDADAGESEPAPQRSAAAELHNRSDEIPAWFEKAQQRAKKTFSAVKSSQKGRFASALDAATAESAGTFEKMDDAKVTERPTGEASDQAVQDAAPESPAVPVPQWAPVTDEAEDTADGAPDETVAAPAPEPVVTPAVDASAPAPVAAPVADEAMPASTGETAESAEELSASAERPQAADETAAEVETADQIEKSATADDDHTVAFAPIPLDEISAPAAPESSQPSPEPPVSNQVDDDKTRAIAPIDVSDLRASTVPPVSEVPAPSFLSFDNERADEQPAASAPTQQDATLSPQEDENEINVAPVEADDQVIDETAHTTPKIEVPSIDASVAFSAMSERAANTDSPSTTTDFAAIDLEPARGVSVPRTDEPRSYRRPIELPHVGVTGSFPAPIIEKSQQRAPLAEVEQSGEAAAKSLLTMLPSISSAEQQRDESSTGAEGESAASADRAKDLRTSLPTLSGSLGTPVETEEKTGNVAAAGAFVSAAATGSFAPVGDELLKDVDPDDIYVDDADDSDYDEHLTETGAFAGPGYVEMPKSRIHRLFDRFHTHKEKEPEESSAQEWIGVDDQFDARSVGKKRGSWESFRDEQEPDAVDPVYDDEGIDEPADPSAAEDAEREQRDRNGWNGGAFSAKRLLDRALGKEGTPVRIDEVEKDADDTDSAKAADSKPAAQETDASADADTASPTDAPDAEATAPSDDSAMPSDQTNEQPASDASDNEEGAEPLFPDTDEAMEEINQLNAELAQVHRFRNPEIDTEVWFVALGSELADNNGMRAFLDAHEQDLRGAIIIDLDALGAGELSLVDQEGGLKVVKTSSRMKRYLKKATAATGTQAQTVSLPGNESTASFAIKHGHQAMHLVGIENGKPAYAGQADDVADNVDDDLLSTRAEYVMELVKNI